LDGGKQLLDLPIQFRKFQIQDRPPGMHHQIQRAGELPQVFAHCRPQAPAYPVALHGAPQDLAHGKTHARARGVSAFAVKHSDVPGELLLAMLVNRLKIRVLQKS